MISILISEACQEGLFQIKQNTQLKQFEFTDYLIYGSYEEYENIHILAVLSTTLLGNDTEQRVFCLLQGLFVCGDGD